MVFQARHAPKAAYAGHEKNRAVMNPKGAYATVRGLPKAHGLPAAGSGRERQAELQVAPQERMLW